jgi:hypothetical protein
MRPFRLVDFGRSNERSFVYFAIFLLAPTMQTLESSKDMSIPANMPWLSSVPRCLGPGQASHHHTESSHRPRRWRGRNVLRDLVYDRS